MTLLGSVKFWLTGILMMGAVIAVLVALVP